MRRWYFLSSTFILYFGYGVFLSQYDWRVLSKNIESKNPPGYYDYSGVVNVHSNLSTGSGSLADIVSAAQEAKLDFIYITDLNVFDFPQDFEGYHQGTLVFAGVEYSYLNSRLLRLNAQVKSAASSLGQAQAILADHLSQSNQNAQEGVYILAHPLKPKFQWVGDYPPGLHGLEIINLKSVWQNGWLNHRLSFFWSLLIYPFNDRLALLRLFQEPKAELQLWDHLNQKSRLVGVAGADAESRIRISNHHFLRFPSYITLFNLVRNHVLLTSELTGDFKGDSAKIMTALKAGNFYFSLDILADPRGFATWITRGQERLPMGSEIPLHNSLELHVRLPDKPMVPFEIVILKDNQRMMTTNSAHARYHIHGPGTYRVAVRVIPTLPLPDGKQWFTWIYSNPFFVRSP